MEERHPNKELYLPVAIVIASIILGVAIVWSENPLQFGSTKSTTPTTPTTPTQPTQAGGRVNIPLSSNEHIRGNPSSPITIVEFSDLQCPFCQRFHPTLQQALQEYGDQVRWVYKHFPLEQIHPEATPAALASECVWEQKGDDGFWQFVDGVFEDQERIGSALYRELAQQTGVNINQFDGCVAQRKYEDKVRADYDLGVQSGVTGTPGSFVNGTPVQGAVPYEQLKSIIDTQIQ